MRIFDLMIKDLMQIIRDWKAAAFLIIMPIGFTILIGFVFNPGPSDPRLPVGFVDEDHGALSPVLQAFLEQSSVIKLVTDKDREKLEEALTENDLTALVIIPAGYSEGILSGADTQLTVIMDTLTEAGRTTQSEIQAVVSRLQSAVLTANISTQTYEAQQAFTSSENRRVYFMDALERSVDAWSSPPVVITVAQTSVEEEKQDVNRFSHSSPAMMAQFTIAGLIGAAEVLVVERKSRSLQRLLTTPLRRWEIMIGHYLAMFVMIFAQLITLVIFGQIVLKLEYISQPVASLLMVVASSLFAAGMGLLLGALAKSEEHVVILTMIPMFIFAGLGGAWMPLEFAPKTLQVIGHLTPVAWMMDGFEGILLRGYGLPEIMLPAVALLGFALLFVLVAVVKFRYE